MVTVSIYDMDFSISRGNLPHNFDKEGNPHWENFKDMLRFLGSIGFYVGEDKEIKTKYPALNDSRRAGGFGNLRYKAEFYPNNFKIEFYQDVYHENPCGGYYDFDKYKKMPYLIQKRYDWTQEKLINYFEKQGFSVEYRENTCTGEAFIINDYVKSFNHPQEKWFSLSDIEGETTKYEYNGKDRDGNLLHNGEIKYFRDWNGYLYRGKIYHNINNMWWVLLPDGIVKNEASYELFDLMESDFLGRQKTHYPPKEYVERKKQLALCSTKELENELKRRKRGYRWNG